MKIGSVALRRTGACALLVLAALGGCAAALPADAGPARRTGGSPVAVFVHGGGWTAGAPAMGRPMIGFFESRTFAFDAIDYPKRPLTPLALMVKNVRSQLLDAARVGPLTVIGHSVGAHLAAAAAFGPDAPPIRCLILLDGIGYDLPDLLARAPGFSRRLGLLPALAAPLSPTALVATSGRHPAVFIAAGNDRRGTADQARVFTQVLAANGRDVTLKIFKDAEHGDFLHALALPDSAIAKSVAAFLAAHPRCGGKA